MDRKFAVVEFTTERSVALVPKKWLREENSRCFWPKNLTCSFASAVKRLIEPEKGWTLCPARLLRTLDDYDRGLNLAERAENTSDLDTSDEESVPSPENNPPATDPGLGIGCRSQKIPKLGSQGHSDQSFTGRALEFSFKEPDLPLCTDINSAIESPLCSNGIDTLASDFQPLGSTTTDLSTGSLGDQNVLLDISNSYFAIPNVPPELVSIRAEIDEIKTWVAEKLITIKEGIREINHSTPSSFISGSSSKLAELLALIPIADNASLAEFDSAIQDQENAKLFKHYLGSIGGGKIGEVTRSILSKVFSRSFAVKGNFSGMNGKVAFGGTKLHQTVIESVRHHFPKETVSEKNINKEIRNWFRGAPDRNGGRKRPNKRKVSIEQDEVSEN